MASFLETARAKAQEVAAKAQEVTSSAAEAAERTRDAANELAARATEGASVAMGDKAWGLSTWWSTDKEKSPDKENSPAEAAEGDAQAPAGGKEDKGEGARGAEAEPAEGEPEQVRPAASEGGAAEGGAEGTDKAAPSSTSVVSSTAAAMTAGLDVSSTSVGKAAAAAAAAWSSMVPSTFLPSTSGITLGPASSAPSAGGAPAAAAAAAAAEATAAAGAAEAPKTSPAQDSHAQGEDQAGGGGESARPQPGERTGAPDAEPKQDDHDPKADGRTGAAEAAADNAEKADSSAPAEQAKEGSDAAAKAGDASTSGVASASSLFATVAARAQDYHNSAAEAAERTRGVASELAARASEGVTAAVGDRGWALGDLTSWTSSHKSTESKAAEAAAKTEPASEAGAKQQEEEPAPTPPAAEEPPAAAQPVPQDGEQPAAEAEQVQKSEQGSEDQAEAPSPDAGAAADEGAPEGWTAIAGEGTLPEGEALGAPGDVSKGAAAGKAVLAMTGMRRAAGAAGAALSRAKEVADEKVQRTKDGAKATLMRAREAAEDIDTVEIMVKVEGGMEKALLGMLQPVIEGIPSLAIAPAKQAAEHFLSEASGDVDAAIEAVIKSVRVGVGTVVAEFLVSRVPVAGTGAILMKTLFSQLRAIVLVGCLLGHDMANSAESQSLALFCLVPQGSEPMGDTDGPDAADVASPSKSSRSQAVKQAARVVGKTVARKGLKSATGWKSAAALFDLCAAVLGHTVAGSEEETGSDVAAAARRASKLFRPLPRTDSPLVMGGLVALVALPVAAGIARTLFNKVLLRPWAPPLWLSLPVLLLLAVLVALRLRDWLYTSDQAPQISSEAVFVFYAALPFLAIFDSTELVILSLEQYNPVYACLGMFGFIRLARRESEAARVLARTAPVQTGTASSAASPAVGDGKPGPAKDVDAGAEAPDPRLYLPEPAAFDRAQLAVIVLALALAGGDWATRGLRGSAVGRTHHVAFHIAKFAALLAEQALLERLRRPTVLLHYIGASRMMRLSFGLLLRGAGASLGALVTPREFRQYLASVAPRPLVTFVALVLRVPLFFAGASPTLAALWRMHLLGLAWPLLAGFLGALAGMAGAAAAGQVRAAHREALTEEERAGERLVLLMPETTAKARSAAQSTLEGLRAAAIGAAARSSTYFFGQYAFERASRFAMNFFAGKGSEAAATGALEKAAVVVEEVAERAAEVADATK